MSVPSALLTILWVLPRLLGELDSVNAMISTETESLRKESKYERPCLDDPCCQSKRQKTSHQQPRYLAPADLVLQYRRRPRCAHRWLDLHRSEELPVAEEC